MTWGHFLCIAVGMAIYVLIDTAIDWIKSTSTKVNMGRIKWPKKP